MRLHGFTTLPPQTEKKICRIFKEIKKIEQTDVTALLKKNKANNRASCCCCVVKRHTHKKGPIKAAGGFIAPWLFFSFFLYGLSVVVVVVVYKAHTQTTTILF